MRRFREALQRFRERQQVLENAGRINRCNSSLSHQSSFSGPRRADSSGQLQATSSVTRMITRTISITPPRSSSRGTRERERESPDSVGTPPPEPRLSRVEEASSPGSVQEQPKSPLTPSQPNSPLSPPPPTAPNPTKDQPYTVNLEEGDSPSAISVPDRLRWTRESREASDSVLRAHSTLGITHEVPLRDPSPSRPPPARTHQRSNSMGLRRRPPRRGGRRNSRGLAITLFSGKQLIIPSLNIENTVLEVKKVWISEM